MSGTLLERRTAATDVESDAELLDRARAGERDAFAELWVRHAGAAARVARGFTWIDADDLVAEAYARILRAVRAGAGPRTAFRPYLYATIRNLARSWGAARRDVAVEDLADVADDAVDDPAVRALDRTLTARAFRTLPERWQAVLWYSEVEGMEPREIAPLLGMSANSAAALAYRAREGLRRAWLQAHVSADSVRHDCRWALHHLGEGTRHALGARAARRMRAHLAECARCAIVAEEVDDIGSRLASVLLPLVLGGAAGGGVLGLVAAPAPAVASAGLLAGLAAAALLAGGLAVGTSTAPEPPVEPEVVVDAGSPDDDASGGLLATPGEAPSLDPAPPAIPDLLDRDLLDDAAPVTVDVPLDAVLKGLSEAGVPPLEVEVRAPGTAVDVASDESVVLRLDLPLLPEIVIRRD